MVCRIRHRARQHVRARGMYFLNCRVIPERLVEASLPGGVFTCVAGYTIIRKHFQMLLPFGKKRGKLRFVCCRWHPMQRGKRAKSRRELNIYGAGGRSSLIEV